MHKIYPQFILRVRRIKLAMFAHSFRAKYLPCSDTDDLFLLVYKWSVKYNQTGVLDEVQKQMTDYQ
jgi:hypothetical protein